MQRRITARPLVSAALLATPLLAAAAARGQAAGTQTSNPYPNAIPFGNVVVNLRTVATLPSSGGANDKVRMNSSATAPDGRLFVVDQRGAAYTVPTTGTASAAAAPAYFDLNAFGLSLLNDDGERGMGQIAFSPQFNQAGTPGYGKLYASFSTSNLTPTPDFTTGQGRDHDEVVYEFTTATPAAATFTQAAGVAPRQVLRLAHPASNHNGDGLAFNPNAVPGTSDYGALYYSMGDGGGGGDPYGQGQNTATPFASILRINPLGTNGTGGDHGIVADNAFAADGNANTLAEVYAYGLRNPQRFSWDKPVAAGGTGRLIAGDIGQGTVEEADVITNGGNYGWSKKEGSFDYVNGNTVAIPTDVNDPAYVRPLAEYDHSEGISVSGGFVYRGPAIPGLDGMYVFGDLANGRIFYTPADAALGGGQDAVRELRLSNDGGATQLSLLSMIDQTTGAARADLRFGEDAAGDLYVLNKHDGVVRLITAVPEPTSVAGVLLLAAGLAGRRRR